MSDCCSSNNTCDNERDKKNTSPRKFTCPSNNKDYVSVSFKTIIHHLKTPWEKEFSEENYYFCGDPDCDVVYFGLSGSVICKSELRTVVGIKDESNEALVCYCFGVSKLLAKQNPDIKTYVTQQTKEKNCACDTRNPSGRCCLKDFPKQIQ